VFETIEDRAVRLMAAYRSSPEGKSVQELVAEDATIWPEALADVEASEERKQPPGV
jgi:hypothetical protein